MWLTLPLKLIKIAFIKHEVKDQTNWHELESPLSSSRLRLADDDGFIKRGSRVMMISACTGQLNQGGPTVTQKINVK